MLSTISERDVLKAKAILNGWKDQYSEQKGKRDGLEKDLKEKSEKIKSVNDYCLTLEQTNILLQKTSEYQRKKACRQIEELGTFALQYIFGPTFKLIITLREVRKKPEAEIYVSSMEDGREIVNTPQDSRGGGIVDIVSLALKIVSLQAFEPFIDGPIILDEPGKHVSAEYIESLSKFLKEVSIQFNRQIILITHNPYLAEVADKRFMVVLQNGSSTVTNSSVVL
jgi:predicted ATP-dependent endonuclease of OLD family